MKGPTRALVGLAAWLAVMTVGLGVPYLVIQQFYPGPEMPDAIGYPVIIWANVLGVVASVKATLWALDT